MENIAAIIGSISGLASLLGIVYMLGWWKGKVDTKLRDLTDMMSQYPPAETALMAKTLWNIYVVDALRASPDLFDHHSDYKLKKETHDMIPDALKQELDQIPLNPTTKEDLASGWLVVKHLGMETITKWADEVKLSVPVAIAVLGTYLDEKLDPR